MAHEYYAVILEVSPRFVRIGFAGESAPHNTFDSSSAPWAMHVLAAVQPAEEPRFLGFDSHLLTPDQQRQLHTAYADDEDTQMALQMFKKDCIEKKTVAWSHDEFRLLARFVRHLLLYELLVSPDNVKLFVVNDESWSVVHRLGMSRSLLSSRISSVMFLPRFPMIAMLALVEECMVVDVSWEGASVVAVSDLRVVSLRVLEDVSEERLHYTRGSFEEGRIENVCEEIVRFLDALPVDIRPGLAKNIVFVGTAFNRSIEDSLVGGLRARLPRMDVCKRANLGVWAGASIYCYAVLLQLDRREWKHRELTLDKIQRGKWDVLL